MFYLSVVEESRHEPGYYRSHAILQNEFEDLVAFLLQQGEHGNFGVRLEFVRSAGDEVRQQLFRVFVFIYLMPPSQ